MGWLAELLRPTPRASLNADPNDERTWITSPIGGSASSGVYVNADTALQASPVWACVRLLAESLASLPVIIYRRTADGGKERATDHPLYELLHDQPNPLQTAFGFKRAMMAQALLFGNAYAQIAPGTRGAVDSLNMLYADRVHPEALPGGGIRYMVTGNDGIARAVNDEDVFHLPGLSLDGITGLSLIRYARESIGLVLAAEGYSSRFYSQNARPGGILRYPKALTVDAAARLRTSWQEAHAGLGNAHQVAVLEEGAEWQQTGMTNQDAELIAQLDWSIADVARYFNVPLHMIQQMTKTTSWGSGIEEMSIEFVTYSLLPWVRNWEDTIRKDLIVAKRTYFAEFLLEGLLRGKQSDRYTAYNTGRQGGWLSVNEIRRFENMNAIEGGDQYLSPLNMAPVGPEPAPQSAAAEPTPPEEPAAAAHYQLLLREAAGRVVRKEIAAMSRAAKRCGEDRGAWAAAVQEFYATHGRFVAETLHIPVLSAECYVIAQLAALLTAGPDAMDDWEARRVDDLIALAGGSNGDG
jgi:HK97 family phage portal protein